MVKIFLVRGPYHRQYVDVPRSVVLADVIIRISGQCLYTIRRDNVYNQIKRGRLQTPAVDSEGRRQHIIDIVPVAEFLKAL